MSESDDNTVSTYKHFSFTSFSKKKVKKQKTATSDDQNNGETQIDPLVVMNAPVVSMEEQQKTEKKCNSK